MDILIDGWGNASQRTNQKDLTIVANSNLTVESKSTETGGMDVRTVRTIKNPWDVQWDVRDINWVSIYGTDEYVKVDFGSDGGVRMSSETARKVLEELSNHFAEAESVV